MRKKQDGNPKPTIATIAKIITQVAVLRRKDTKLRRQQEMYAKDKNYEQAARVRDLRIALRKDIDKLKQGLRF